MRPVILMLTLCSLAAAQADKSVSFEKDVMPIFKASCISCHKADKKGGKQGTPVKPGDPAKSLLIEMVGGKEPEMPEKGDPLKPEQVEILTRWIQQGAKP
jgi:mono/diheme cytochrome c family protein